MAPISRVTGTAGSPNLWCIVARAGEKGPEDAPGATIGEWARIGLLRELECSSP